MSEVASQSDPNRVPKLPPELLLHIIDHGLPTCHGSILPASHIVTRTLISWLQVSRSTYQHASRLLRERCVYLDSSRRLADVLLCLPRCVPSLRSTLLLRNVTGIYLAPFGATLDDQPTAMWVRELLCEVSETLRRLVVHMPFATLDRLTDHLNVRKILREGFEMLHGLQEFACVGDYPSLSLEDGQTDIWRLWPNLRRLALFNVPLDNHWLWWDIATLPELSCVVLARPQLLKETNIKKEYFHKLPRDDPRLEREIKILLMDVDCSASDVLSTDWKRHDPKNRMTIEVFEVPTAYYGDETAHEVVTSWAKRGALEGSLWGWDGIKCM